ncbi:hypothetical protein JJB74_27710 [Noviherbaspirillum sp. DKR-6]|uniref:Transposase n=2 Tax=Noviherbaspirillum pedocola TaxID=2801341 RepID=A0A934T0H2_9BURK|nr:hypothetical protein [Noviherbaspirillum pedocola]
MTWVATTEGIDAGLVSDLMMQAVEYRFCPNSKAPTETEWLTDNGRCYTAVETRLLSANTSSRYCSAIRASCPCAPSSSFWSFAAAILSRSISRSARLSVARNRSSASWDSWRSVAISAAKS